MECMSFSRLFMAVSLILIYVIQKLVGLAHQASPVNLKPLHEDMDVRHLAFEDQLQFIDSDEYKTDKLLDDIQLDSVSVSYLSVSVLLFELNERQGCLGAANYSVIRTFSAVNVGQMVLQIKGFKIGSTSTASNILRGRLYNIAKQPNTHKHDHNYNNHYPQQQQQQQQQHHHHHHHHNHQQQKQTNQHNYNNNNNNINVNKNNQQSICHGYGFTIFDCEPFDLEPNREHKIRIAFNPDFTLTKTIVSLTILTNLDEEFKFALVASIPRNLLATCNQSLPRPDWEPTMHLILAVGMVIMILVSILSAYMEAMLYLKSQQTATAQSNNNQHANNHQNGGSNKDYERNNCSNHSNDTYNKDRGNGSGHGAAAATISASISSHQHSSSTLSFNAITNSGKNNNNSNNNINSNKTNNSTSNNGKSNNFTQKRRKNSSTANSEKVPTSSSKSAGSSTTDKKSSSPYTPIFQNLTNVIASPPPPLPTFDNEFDPLESKKLRNRKSSKKSNSLNGSIASSDDIGNPSSLNQSSATNLSQTGKAKTTNGKSSVLKMIGGTSTSSERDTELSSQHDRSSPVVGGSRKCISKDVFTSASTSDEDSCHDAVNNYSGSKNSRSQQEQTNVMPIQPPSSLSSTPSSSSTASSSSSSASSSPPLSASSYGEYSLLGPGATFELPCLRVRSAQI